MGRPLHGHRRAGGRRRRRCAGHRHPPRRRPGRRARRGGRRLPRRPLPGQRGDGARAAGPARRAAARVGARADPAGHQPGAARRGSRARPRPRAAAAAVRCRPGQPRRPVVRRPGSRVGGRPALGRRRRGRGRDLPPARRAPARHRDRCRACPGVGVARVRRPARPGSRPAHRRTPHGRATAPIGAGGRGLVVRTAHRRRGPAVPPPGRLPELVHPRPGRGGVRRRAAPRSRDRRPPRPAGRPVAGPGRTGPVLAAGDPAGLRPRAVRPRRAGRARRSARAGRRCAVGGPEPAAVRSRRSRRGRGDRGTRPRPAGGVVLREPARPSARRRAGRRRHGLRLHPPAPRSARMGPDRGGLGHRASPAARRVRGRGGRLVGSGPHLGGR